MGGVASPKTSVRVGDADGGSEEQGVKEEAESGGLQGCVCEGRLPGGVEARAGAGFRIPESSVDGLEETMGTARTAGESHTHLHRKHRG